MGCAICGKDGHNRTTCPERNREGENLPIFFYVLLVFLLIILGIWVWQLPNINKFDSRSISYVIHVMVSAVASVILFGVLRSSGTFRGSRWGFQIELGGPAALFIVVLLIGVWFEINSDNNTFSITIYLVSTEDDTTNVNCKGTVTLRTNPPLTTQIKEGIAEFRSLPLIVLDNKVDYSIDITGYKVDSKTQKQITLKSNASIKIFIKENERGGSEADLEKIESFFKLFLC